MNSIVAAHAGDIRRHNEQNGVGVESPPTDPEQVRAYLAEVQETRRLMRDNRRV